MSLELAKRDIEYLKRAQEDTNSAVKALTAQLTILNTQLLEIQLGRRWLWGLLSAAAVAGALVDTLLRILKVW